MNQPNLDNLPVELRKVAIRKIRWCMQEGVQGIDGCSIECPYDPKHFMLYHWSQAMGLDLLFCTHCGYRYVPIKVDGKIVLKNFPEIKKKGLVIRKR